MIKECFHCCNLYGYSTLVQGDKKEFLLILQDYGVSDIFDYMNKYKYWTPFENKELTGYHYKNDGVYYSYTLEREEKMKITSGICDAIEELHNKNIVHSDLKLENMIYDSKENIVRLIDFGCSCYLKTDSYCYSDENMGTMGYMSEDISYGHITKRGDIYSLGVLLLELWLGDIWLKDIEEGTDESDSCYNEVMYGLTRLREIEPELSKIIKSCVSKEIKDRPFIKTVKRRVSKIK